MRRARQVPSGRKRQRAEPYCGCLGHRGQWGRAVPAENDAEQRLHPRHAADGRGYVAEAVPQAAAGTQEQGPDRRRAERELLGELLIAQPANLTQKKGVPLCWRHLPDFVPHARHLLRVQNRYGGVHGRGVLML